MGIAEPVDRRPVTNGIFNPIYESVDTDLYLDSIDTKTVGLFRPPFEYAPGQTGWKWHKDGWCSAFSGALLQKGIKKTADEVRTTYEKLLNDSNNKAKISSLLYDPADRDTAVFKDEAAASFMATYGDDDNPYSLIIICPYVRADGIDWERIYDTHNRPPIYSRWSTGEQALYEPIVLMCLPQLETKLGRESYNKSVDWFTMDPLVGSKFSQEVMYQSTVWTEEKLQLYIGHNKFPEELGTEAFRKAFVRIHRMVALGYPIHDRDLHSYIEQYGKHLLKVQKYEQSDSEEEKEEEEGEEKNDSRPVFTFEPNMGGYQVPYRVVTGIILNPSFRARHIAEDWDDAIEAYIKWSVQKDDKLAEKCFDDFARELEYAAKNVW
ncbi:hypothetical protein ACET3X_006479 [Alternaria dauci]|uniref:Uncharacterized protein n=1 Tax=Alternaria dauci TaxID=48095 RepID=A0ABR3UDW6_9PLEO